MATFRIVADTLGERVRAIETLTKEQPALVRSHLRTRLFLQHGLHVAALREAEGIVRQRPDSERGWSAMLRSLTDMGLENTLMWAETRDHVLRGGE